MLMLTDWPVPCHPNDGLTGPPWLLFSAKALRMMHHEVHLRDILPSWQFMMMQKELAFIRMRLAEGSRGDPCACFYKLP